MKDAANNIFINLLVIAILMIIGLPVMFFGMLWLILGEFPF